MLLGRIIALASSASESPRLEPGPDSLLRRTHRQPALLALPPKRAAAPRRTRQSPSAAAQRRAPPPAAAPPPPPCLSRPQPRVPRRRWEGSACVCAPVAAAVGEAEAAGFTYFHRVTLIFYTLQAHRCRNSPRFSSVCGGSYFWAVTFGSTTLPLEKRRIGGSRVVQPRR